MLTLLKDTDNSINSLYKSIDNDTELPKSIADQIPETSSNKAKAYNFGTLHEQAERRLDYVTGKNGIGPFALNVTNHVLTCLFGVKFRETKFTEQTGIFNFDKLVDDDGNMISSWLSAFINAHVDIVKDPWISKMGVDPFTYNMVNLLIRSGFGEAGMWFIAQPIIKDMANASSTASSQFTRDTFKYKSVYAAQKDAVANAVMAYLDEDDVKESKLETYIGSNPSSEQVGARINAVNYIKTHQKLLKEIAINPEKKTVIVDGKEYNVKEVQKTIFYAWKTLEKYSIALSTLVQYTKIDTCKQGKTFIEMYRYLDMYDRLLNNDKSLWDRESIKNLAMNSWIESKTRDTCRFPFKVLSTQLFNANENFIQRLVLPICNALKNADDPLNVDMMNEVSQSLQTSLKSKYIVDYAHHQLGMTDQDISNLFVGPRSMNHRFNMLWNAIRTNPKYSYLANNQLLTHLYSVNEESEVWVNGRQYERPSFLSISDSIEDSRLNSDLMIDGWEDLLRDSDVNVKNFAKDLIIYAFLTSGEYKGWNRLFKFVPPAWVRGEVGSFEKVGSFSDYIRKLLSGDTLSSIQYQSYLDEIIANHFSDNRFSTRVGLKDKDGNNNFITCGDIIAIGAGKENEQNFPKYITIKKSGRSGKNTSDYTTYRFSYSFSTKENPKILYPVYARAKRKGYQSMDGKFNIYEYGWHFNYVENESNAFSTFDYDEALMKVAVYLSTHPITQNQIDNATNASILSDRISKVYLGYVPDQVEDNNNQTESVSQGLQTVTNVVDEDTTKTQKYKENNLGFNSMNEVIMNSGGAYGADTAWDFYARNAGVKQINHYRDQGNQVLSSSLNKRGVKATVLSKEQMEYARRREFELLGKQYDDTLQGNLQVRNFYQVASSDGVFAVAFMNSTKNGVSGGTNTAVQLGISLNKPTHVFDLNSEKWYKYNPKSKMFEEESTPVLTKSFAGVGTRDIQKYNVYKDGKWVEREQYVGDDKSKVALKAIENVFNKTQTELSNVENNTDHIDNTNEFYEVSTAASKYKMDITKGDATFSALNAKFKNGTVIDGVDVGGRTIEDVYQSVIKKSRKGQAPSKDSKLHRTSVSSYTGDVTPDANTIFVFGSNPEGRHGAGAARVAREQFGAIYGQGEGLQGNAYALPTKDLRVTENKIFTNIHQKGKHHDKSKRKIWYSRRTVHS